MSKVAMECAEQWIGRAGKVPNACGTAALTVSVTTSAKVLFAAPGAVMVTVAVYTFGRSPDGFTVTVTKSKRPASEMLPVGETFSQGAAVMPMVAESGVPLLASTQGAVRLAAGIGFAMV